MKRAKKGTKLALALPILYVATFFCIFDVESSGAFREPTSRFDPFVPRLIGPSPWFFYSFGYTEDNTINGDRFYHGKEWPFIFYRPLVLMYNHFKKQELAELDKRREERRQAELSAETK